MHTLYQSNLKLMSTIIDQQLLIAQLRWNDSLGMYNHAGLMHAIATLPSDTTYTVVFADIDRLKALNSATGNHLKTNRYLATGLQVRKGEIAGQFAGDEFIFILAENSRNEDANPDAFVARIARQLAGQPLTISERYALAAAHGCPVDQARLSATFSAMSGVKSADVAQAIEWLSSDVLTLKAERDSKVTI